MAVGELILRLWEDKAQAMWRNGVSSADIGLCFGVSKSVISGLARRREWGVHPSAVDQLADERPVRTLFDRCAALHARMDALLAECRAIPTVKPTGRRDGERRVVDYRPGR